jgi:hypothetical protein
MNKQLHVLLMCKREGFRGRVSFSKSDIRLTSHHTYYFGIVSCQVIVTTARDSKVTDNIHGM